MQLTAELLDQKLSQNFELTKEYLGEKISENFQLTKSYIDQVITGFKQHVDLNFATKEELSLCATKEDLKTLVTKEEAKNFATKDDLKVFATKDDLAPIRQDIRDLRADLLALRSIVVTKVDFQESMDEFKREIKELLGVRQSR